MLTKLKAIARSFRRFMLRERVCDRPPSVEVARELLENIWQRSGNK